jgi:diguanylate cyclase (GGDEF)-like protein
MSNTPAPIQDLSAVVAGLDATADHRGVAPHLAVAVADLDRFAEVNVTHGQEVGDRVLATFERTLAASLPTDATVARIGGDEYLVALPGTSAESALIQLEEIRSHYVAHGVEGVDGGVNASFGIAARPPHADDTAEVVRCAAQALMRAKREGSGRSVIYVEEKMTMKSNYYPRAILDRLSKLSGATSRTEASLLREALDDLLVKHRDKL